MPELPEVECLVNALKPVLTGAIVEDIIFHRSDLRDPLPQEEFNHALKGQRISSLGRRGKYMIWTTESDSALFHLGMSGRFHLEETLPPKCKHTHVVFKVKSPKQKKAYLHYIDPRRFGRMGFHAGLDFEKHSFVSNLGLEPLADTGGSSLVKSLFKQSRDCSQAIKVFLMDASRLVGVGNIYASEALFRAKIHPQRSAKSLSKQEFVILVAQIQETLKSAIEAGGTTLKDYLHPEGKNGSFQFELKVYGRVGKPCINCRLPLEQMRQVGRSTFFCPSCQPNE